MSPFGAWIAWAVGGGVYQVGRVSLGLQPTPETLWASVYWTGFAMLMVQLGSVAPPNHKSREGGDAAR